VLGLPRCSCAPRQRPGAIVGVLRLVKGGGLPEERGELAGDGDRNDAGGFASLVVQTLPALVQASPRAPGDLDDARGSALLAASEGFGDRGLFAVVLGGFDEQPGGRAESRRR
jgi:hypothetical protein